jgi:hypothetical protein
VLTCVCGLTGCAGRYRPAVAALVRAALREELEAAARWDVEECSLIAGDILTQREMRTVMAARIRSRAAALREDDE